MCPIYGTPTVQPNPTTYDKDVFIKFVPKFKKFVEGDGSVLYDTFFTIANQKILSQVWNVDWEFAMSYCIAHYIDLINRETQVSFGLGDIAEESGPKGVTLETTFAGRNKTTDNFELVALDHRYAKFWNTTEFGKILITLLETKGVSTLLVVN